MSAKEKILRIVRAADDAVRHPRHAAALFRIALADDAQYPDVQSLKEWQQFRENLPPVVQRWFDEQWKKDQKTGTALRPVRRHRHLTDIVYLGSLKADAHKDLAALRQFGPRLRITVILFARSVPREQRFILQYADSIVSIGNQAELVEFLLSVDARAVVMQGGDDVPALLNTCMYPGRLVWQVRDTTLRIPREYLENLLYERAKYIAERADAIVSFHDESGWRNIAGFVRFRSPPCCIPPMCVLSIGPRRCIPKLSDADGEAHLVYAGGAGSRGGSRMGSVLFTHADFTDKFRVIAEQGIHLHLYSPHLKRENEANRDYFELQRACRYFHIEPVLPFEELLIAITRYDWGITHVTWQPEFLIPGFDRAVQNGLTQHIQAGLPVIVSPTAYGNADLVMRTHRGLVVAEADMPRLKQILLQSADLPRQCSERPLEPELLYDVHGFGKAVLPA
ncbi:MAG: hypothetical protein Greene041619_81 [Candidatus Peregrinibacteria bacterium Greene0416_19]|nr:MAG: hypothetical protein Greene041619_81 [Candidatus Peregrinibacteria bacterium Greene0416_19]